MASFEFEDVTVLDQTGYKATAAMIFLHGANETGSVMKENFLKYLGDKGHPYFQFYFPTAPERYLTIRDMKQRYWFDVVRTGPVCDDVKSSVKDAEEVSSALERLIGKIVVSGIPRDRIVIGGVSQGGMVSIYASYTRGIKVGGVVGIAACFPFLKQTTLLDGVKTPLLSIYGEKDAFITQEAMERAWQLFKLKKLPLTIKKLRQRGHDMHIDYAKVMFQWLKSEFQPLEWF